MELLTDLPSQTRASPERRGTSGPLSLSRRRSPRRLARQDRRVQALTRTSTGSAPGRHVGVPPPLRRTFFLDHRRNGERCPVRPSRPSSAPLLPPLSNLTHEPTVEAPWSTQEAGSPPDAKPESLCESTGLGGTIGVTRNGITTSTAGLEKPPRTEFTKGPPQFCGGPFRMPGACRASSRGRS